MDIPAFSVDPMKSAAHSQALQKIAEAGGTVRNKSSYIKMKSWWDSQEQVQLCQDESLQQVLSCSEVLFPVPAGSESP